MLKELERHISRMILKCTVLYLQHDCFPPINQPYHCFLILLLQFSMLKVCIIDSKLFFLESHLVGMAFRSI